LAAVITMSCHKSIWYRTKKTSSVFTGLDKIYEDNHFIPTTEQRSIYTKFLFYQSSCMHKMLDP